ncbi:hypothetical protein TPL01_26360 [Sulfuriferula plumbiphila]|uniref:Transglutaminase-like domain-containing protein n=1 Tax=Sulfuriferula plumbiphila TaxID=171865 RepID=A0A512LAK1_9PROT|nr:hypothetical protein SFPGR_23570 [Sulfuriferula plumbiphila]GEP31498.1 hypothetical protein TPL01_26360 [Sulfuriferula plumbiphila]
MMRVAALGIGLVSTVPAWAVTANVCYNCSCARHANVNFSVRQMHALRQLFKCATTPPAERSAIANAIGQFERFAGEQTPTWRDKGGNANDDGADGRLDCIGDSTTNTTYLRLLQRLGLLRFHALLAPVERAPLIVNVHWATHIMDRTERQEYAVNSWFYDNSQPAVISPLQDWLSGASPDV